jgi:hypothetical protein
MNRSADIESCIDRFESCSTSANGLGIGCNVLESSRLTRQRSELCVPATSNREQQPGNMLSRSLVIAWHVDGQPCRLPAHERADNCLPCNFAPPLRKGWFVRFYGVPRGLNDEDANWIGKEPLNLSIEPFSIRANTSDEILERLPFNGNDMLQSTNGIVTCRQRGCDRGQWLQVQWCLLSAVDNRDDVRWVEFCR